MIGLLPKTLNINGKNYRIRSDFRVALNIFEAMEDEYLSDKQKAYVCLKSLFYDDIASEDIQEAIEKAYWFLDGGDMPKVKSDGVKSFDWKQDEPILFPAVNKVAGYETRACKYLHWWTFLGFFNEIGEGLFSTVMSIRQKRLNGKKLEKWEKEIYRTHKDMINLYSEQDKREIAETEAYMNELLGITTS